MKDKWTRILVIAVAVIFILFIGRNTIIKASIENGTRIVTGLKLTMKSLNIGVMNTLVGIKDIKLHNPKGFKDKVMLDMPEIYVDYNLPDIFKDTIWVCLGFKSYFF